VVSFLAHHNSVETPYIVSADFFFRVHLINVMSVSNTPGTDH
jgi:hypothetical protein